MGERRGGQARITGLRHYLARLIARVKFAGVRTRLLWADRIGGAGRVVLLVNSPPSQRTVALLAAAFEEPLYWLLDSNLLNAAWPRFIAVSLGAEGLDQRTGAEPTLAENCRHAFAAGGMVAVFSGAPGTGEQSQECAIASRLAIELAKDARDPLDVTIYPIHVFDPPKDSAAREVLIFVDGPVYPLEQLHQADGDPTRAASALAEALTKGCHLNPFRLPAPELSCLLKDLEEILRLDLKEEWAARPGWQQDAKEMSLSQFAADWVERTNARDPARIVALRERVEKSRASRQQWAARQFAADTAGVWMDSSYRRVLAWIESVAGFPVALYGLANHLLAGVFYYFLRMLQKSPASASREKWIAGALGVLAAYTIQILLCNYWLGRATAGYYALTLPVSGVYLWRYHWLARNRTGRIFSHALSPLALRRLQNSRRAVARELDQRIADDCESLGIPQ